MGIYQNKTERDGSPRSGFLGVGGGRLRTYEDKDRCFVLGGFIHRTLIKTYKFFHECMEGIESKKIEFQWIKMNFNYSSKENELKFNLFIYFKFSKDEIGIAKCVKCHE